MSSPSAASALPVTDAASRGGDDDAAATGWRRAKTAMSALSARCHSRMLVAAIAVSLLLHLLAFSGAADWLVEQFRWDEPVTGPPMHAVLLPPPAPVYQAQPTPPPTPPPKPRPKPRPKPVTEPPMFAAAPTIEPVPTLVEPPAPIETGVTPEPLLARAAPGPATQDAATDPAPTIGDRPGIAEQPIPDPVANDPPAPTVKVPKRIDLIGTLFAGERNFMVGTGGFRLRHDGNRYEISVLGTPKGLARLLFAGEFSGVSRGAITPTGLQPSEYSEERGGRDKREVATLDWEAGVVRMKDDKVAPIEPPMLDRLSVILQFYYRPPEATDLTTRVAGTRGVDTYVFRRQKNETIDFADRSVDAQVWRVNHDNGEPRIDLWMSPEYHYLPLRIRVYTRKEFGGRHATLNIDEIRVED